MLNILAAAIVCVGPHIADGDSLTCAGQRVRLAGVQAPELARNHKPAEPYAYESRDRLHELTRGRVVCTEAGNRKDRYGRLVARCAGLVPDVGAQLVREGYARDWPRFSRGEYADEELEARRHHRGIWR